VEYHSHFYELIGAIIKTAILDIIVGLKYTQHQHFRDNKVKKELRELVNEELWHPRYCSGALQYIFDDEYECVREDVDCSLPSLITSMNVDIDHIRNACDQELISQFGSTTRYGLGLSCNVTSQNNRNIDMKTLKKEILDKIVALTNSSSLEWCSLYLSVEASGERNFQIDEDNGNQEIYKHDGTFFTRQYYKEESEIIIMEISSYTLQKETPQVKPFRKYILRVTSINGTADDLATTNPDIQESCLEFQGAGKLWAAVCTQTSFTYEKLNQFLNTSFF
jgi:hypothetical protein